MNKFLTNYNKIGYFKISKFIKKKELLKISDELKQCYKSKKILKYMDKNGKLRRLEKIYDKGVYLKKFNTKSKKLLKKVFGSNFSIFKDKFNVKPAGGEGFFAHYDGIFKFKNHDHKVLNGWYEYSDNFVNILLALNSSDKKNGTIELAKADQGNFNDLLKNTNNDGTPNLKKKYEIKLNFKHINLRAGDVLIFSNKCPHRSKKNRTKKSREIVYYTYTQTRSKNLYNKYFYDKILSKNKKSKSLSGKV